MQSHNPPESPLYKGDVVFFIAKGKSLKITKADISVGRGSTTSQAIKHTTNLQPPKRLHEAMP